MNMRQRIVPVILSGGSGTRLWPSSRTEQPKQFLPLIAGRSTFEDTLERVADENMFSAPVIITGQQFDFLVADQVRKVGMSARIIMEPMRRDSAAAITVAAELARQLAPDALLLTLAADHVVGDRPAFLRAVRAGVNAARNGRIVTFGIAPDSPATGYGYIEPGEAIDAGARSISRFIEKPNAERARELIRNGCLWNSGNFLFRADVMLDELARFEPAIHAATVAAVKLRKIETVGGVSFEQLDTASFEKSPTKSIDFAVMEKTERAAVVPSSYGWSDIGSWDALWNVSDKDDDGNVVNGAATLSASRNSFVSSEGIHAAVIGIEGLAIIATRDVVLVAPREVAGELKAVVAELEKQPSTRVLTERHQSNLTRWGSQQQAFSEGSANVRLLSLNHGKKVQLEAMAHKTLHLIVAKGNAEIAIEFVTSTARQGESFWVAGGQSCEVSNTGKTVLELVEVTVGAAAENAGKVEL